jgi:CHAD domain-containing protein
MNGVGSGAGRGWASVDATGAATVNGRGFADEHRSYGGVTRLETYPDGDPKVAQPAGLDEAAAEPARGDERLEHVERMAQAYLDIQYQALMEGARELRVGRLDAVHRTRVATRRYRSVLREIRDLLDPSAATVLDEGLRWYARVLGDVRDVQVLQDSLADELAALPDAPATQAARRHVDAYCADRLSTASRRLQEGLAKRRYERLADLAGEWHRGMPFMADLHPSSPEALTFLTRAERRFQRRLDAALAAGRPDLLMHEARKSSKRARYVAEMAAPTLGERADQTIRRMTEFQNELGTRQDRVVTIAALTELVSTSSRSDDGAVALFEEMRDRLAPATSHDLDEASPSRVVSGHER